MLISLIMFSSGALSNTTSDVNSEFQLHEGEDRVAVFESLMKQINGPSLPNSEKQDLINTFIEEQKPYGFPITGGEKAYVIYQNATAVNVHYGGYGHFTGLPPMEKVTGTDLWYLLRNYKDDSRVFYGIGVDDVWISDPLNNLTRIFLLDGNVESELRMPNYYDDGSTTFTDDVGSQIINQSFTSDAMDGWTRNLKIYLPPGYDDSGSTRYPAAYVIDTRYLSEGFAENILNYMITNNYIDPMIVVFLNVIGEYELGFTIDMIDWWGWELGDNDCEAEYDSLNNPGKKNLCNSKSIESIATELVPFIDSTYNTLNDSSKRAHIGFSSAADFSSNIVAQYPDVFKLAGIHDGCCVDSFFDLLNTANPEGFRFYLLKSYYWGPFPPTERSEEVVIMEDKGFSGIFRVLNQGHDWGLIQRSFGETLKFLYNDEPSDFAGSPGLGQSTISSTQLTSILSNTTSSQNFTSDSLTKNESDNDSVQLITHNGMFGSFFLVIIINKKLRRNHNN